MSERLNLRGQIIGDWSIGERSIGTNGKSYFQCECLNCGTKRLVKGTALVSGASKSCGCQVHSEESIEKRKKTIRQKKTFVDGTSTNLIRKIYSGERLKNNKSGCTGVSKKGNRWIAEITFKGVNHYLGSHEEYEKAVEARHIAEEQYFGALLKSI